MSASIARFERLLADVAAATAPEQRQSLVDGWIAEQQESPLVGADEAIIWYTGPAAAVVLRGDMVGERSVPLTRVADTTLHFDRRAYAPAARLDYHLVADGADLGDPRNARPIPSGYGPRAQLWMPGYQPTEPWRRRPGAARGRLEEHERVVGVAYPSTRAVRVYLPPGYPHAAPYTTLYFGDGSDYLNFAHVPDLLDNLVADEVLPPCIGVFVDPSVEHGRVVDYDLNAAYARFVAAELVPWIDATYATAPVSARRVVVGASFGGLIALQIGLEHAGVFGNVAAQSAFAGRRDDAIIRRFAAQPRLPLRIHLLIGSYETEVGTWDQPAEGDFVRANRLLRDTLQEKEYVFAYTEYPEGHSWGLWRERLDEALRFLLIGTP